jgi:translocation and assembly module TamA
MRCSRAVFAAAILAFVVPAAAARERLVRQELCPTIEIVGEEKVDLNEVEKKLVCGDSKREGWATIPLPQAEFFLRSFLQQRGYSLPTFEIVKGRLICSTGPMSRVRHLTATGLPPFIRLDRRRKTVGQPLTPQELDRYKQWLKSELQRHGYGCPTIEISADAETGELHADVSSGPFTYVPPLRENVPPSVDSRIFKRYEAFRVGDPLDARLFTITTNRIQADGLFLSAYYDLSCSTESVLTVNHRVFDTPPRQISLGAGIDTEGYVRARGEWKNSRLGPTADLVSAVFNFSKLEQRFLGTANVYPTPGSRLFVAPSLDIELQNAPRYEIALTQAGVPPAYRWDGRSAQYYVSLGPIYQYSTRISGGGPPNDQFVGAQAQLNLVSHDFEFYKTEPTEGSRGALTLVQRFDGIVSDLTATDLRLDGAMIFNVGEYDPPAVIVSWRGQAASTIVHPGDVPLVPLTMRHFLGGSADLEGFSLQELPQNADGFLSYIYQGLEVRAGDVFPARLQPLVVFDAAMGGLRSVELDPNVYLSPGFGIRWPSPVGAVRATLARAYTINNPPGTAPSPHWQLYFSFGQGF